MLAGDAGPAPGRHAPDRSRAARRRLGDGAPIAIGDNVWLGGGAIVCPGVTIGDDTVVARARCPRDLAVGVVAYGNPSRVVRDIGDRDRCTRRRERARARRPGALSPRALRGAAAGQRRRARASRASASTPRCGSRSAPPAGSSTVRARRAGARAALAVGATYALNTAIKAPCAAARPALDGPARARRARRRRSSFPSAHASTSFAAARAYGVARARPRRSTPLAGAMAASRVYLGVHYPSDIAAGALLGLAGGGASAR